MWAQRVEVQKAQKAVIDYIRDATEFDLVRRDMQKQGNNRHQRDSVNEKKMSRKYKYCSTWHQ